MPVQCTCQQCGKTFSVPPSSIKYHANKYCGNDCRYAAARVDPINSVMRRIDRRGGPDACWEYQGSRLPAGYGTHTSKVGGHLYAHRVAYEQAYGPVPDGMHVCHNCDNPPCCNPAHLRADTPDANHAEKYAKNRHARGERSGGSKLNESKVLQVISLEGSMTHCEIGRVVGTSRSNVGRILSGELWGHITGRTATPRRVLAPTG